MMPGLSGLAGLTDGERQLTVGNLSAAYGYTEGVFGSLTPRQFLGSLILVMNWESNIMQLEVTNGSQPNSGWETLDIKGAIFLRSSATFSGGNWQWSGVANPFGTTVGAIIPVRIA